MIDRLQILASRFRHLFNRPRWSRWFLGDVAKLSDPNRPGLILVQIDGLGEDVLRAALDRGQMPFLKSLLEEDGYTLRSLYSGLPSSTPAVQAELFYGVPTAVPAFGFRDRKTQRLFSMNDPSAASTIEQRLKKGSRGLLRGGSAWTNIYSGGAAEPHMCASTVGVRTTLTNLAPRRLAALLLFHSWSVVRVLGNLVIMTVLVFWDLLRGRLGARRFIRELLFIPPRILVSVIMREVSTAGAEIDAGRGLPIIELNFLGYDEHAHRRGPHSTFACWSLRGIDKSVQRVWRAAHRSRAQDYQVWVYSDHGQEEVTPFATKFGRSVPSIVRDLYDASAKTESEATLTPVPDASAHANATAEVPSAPITSETDPSDEQTHSRATWTGHSWAKSETPSSPTKSARPKSLLVTTQGPGGFVYLPKEHSREFVETLAAVLVHKGKIPLTIVSGEDQTAIAYTKDGTYTLPNDAISLFGEDHPHVGHVAHDIVRVILHSSAGEIGIFGWHKTEPLSLQNEWGAHGGPGSKETSAFLLLPPETRGFTYIPETLRPLQVRQLALRVLGQKGDMGTDIAGLTDSYAPPEIVESTDDRREGGRHARLRIMTYNVHGCRGTDGVYSPLRIARVIARERPDIVCLQELDHTRSRSGHLNQAQEIAKRLQGSYHFHAVSEMDDGTFGNAILSLLPLRLIRQGPLPAFERLRGILGLWQRGAVSVAVTIGSEELVVTNTHLSVFPREQRLQAEALCSDRWIGDHVPEDNRKNASPQLLTGDFNAGPRSQTMKILESTLQNSIPRSEVGRHQTWTAALPIRRIDHILHSPSIRALQVYVPRTQVSRVASDHLPLVADIVCEFGQA